MNHQACVELLREQAALLRAQQEEVDERRNNEPEIEGFEGLAIIIAEYPELVRSPLESGWFLDRGATAEGEYIFVKHIEDDRKFILIQVGEGETIPICSFADQNGVIEALSRLPQQVRDWEECVKRTCEEQDQREESLRQLQVRFDEVCTHLEEFLRERKATREQKS